MKKMKKMFALLISLAFILSFSLLASAEETTKSSLSDSAGALGDKLTGLIGSMGGEADFDFSSLFSGIGALGDIDISGYLSNINIGSISEDLQNFAGNFFNTDGGTMPDLGGIANDVGMGDFASMIQNGLGSILGIAGDGTSGGDGTGNSSGGFSDVISGFAGSIADMTGNFDITEVLGGLIGGSSSGSSSGTGTGTTTTTTAPNNTPAVIIGGGSSSSNNGSSSVTIPPILEEPTTQEYTTQRLILQPVDQSEVPTGEETTEKNTGKIVAGVILVLGSFGAVAYIVIKKVI